MRVELTEDIKVKGTPRKAGETVVVRKEEGERLIEKGLAVRLIDEPENRLAYPDENRTRGLPKEWKMGGPMKRITTFDRFGR